MARLLHQLLGIITALALVVSSAGWSMASVQARLDGPAMHHHAGGNQDAGVNQEPDGGGSRASARDHGVPNDAVGHGHHRTKAADAGLCSPTGSDCGSAVPSDGDASSCCAMACHVAVPTGWATVSIVRLARRVRVALATYDVARDRQTRLERPPRRLA
jgi:hypothetical protein